MAKLTPPNEADGKAVLDIMQKLDVSKAEAIQAIKQYANDREFERNLKRHYENMVDDSWDYWHEGNP